MKWNGAIGNHTAVWFLLREPNQAKPSQARGGKGHSSSLPPQPHDDIYVVSKPEITHSKHNLEGGREGKAKTSEGNEETDNEYDKDTKTNSRKRVDDYPRGENERMRRQPSRG